MPVKVDIDKSWRKKVLKGMNKALLEMATDIHKRAAILAPVDTAALVNSGIVEPISEGYRVSFGNDRVPYARRRHFENNKNPGSKRYLAKSGDSVARGDKAKYFRGKV